MRILIVDDHTLFREALVPFLQQLADNVSVIEASNENEALAAAGFYDGVDLVLLDLGLPGIGGLKLLTELRKPLPTTPVVVISGESDPAMVREAIDGGARGFIPKTISAQGLSHALRLVLDGEVFLPLDLLSAAPSATDDAPDLAGPQTAGLTPRQLDVLQLISLGLPNKSIGARLDLSEGTVKLHVSAILRSLDSRNRTAAVREARKRGLLPDNNPLS